MFYQAKHPKSPWMWDVWMYYHNDTYYLYSLCASGEHGFDNFSMATSRDGVHWNEIGPVLARDDGATGMGTGSTWANPVRGGRPHFLINYSSWMGNRETIFFAQSDDLVHWTKCGKKNEFVRDERWYEPKGRWDCIWTVARPGGGLYGYWTATPRRELVNEPCGQFGFGESLDGITWTALEPPKVSGVGTGEVGAIEKVGERYVMLFGSEMRMITLVADRPQGPFTVVARNPVFLGGHTYFARFLHAPSGLLVCHHTIARSTYGKVSVGLLKGTNFDDAGTLRLTWWRGNEVLKHKPVTVPPFAAGGDGPIRMLSRKFDAVSGFVLEGKLQLPTPLGAPRGLYIEHGKGMGTAILFKSEGRAELGSMAADGTGFRPEKTVDREMRFGEPAEFRLLLQDALMEIYLDDFLIECYSLPAPATGRIGVIPGNQRNSIFDLKAWKQSPE